MLRDGRVMYMVQLALVQSFFRLNGGQHLELSQRGHACWQFIHALGRLAPDDGRTLKDWFFRSSDCFDLYYRNQVLGCVVGILFSFASIIGITNRRLAAIFSLYVDQVSPAGPT